MGVQQEGVTKNRPFVWISTSESMAARQVSVLACAEVALAIWLYWWLIPAWFNIHVHLLVSVVVVPFLLLRSETSIKVALDLIEKLLSEGKPKSKPSLVKVVLITSASVMVSFFFFWWSARFLLSGYDYSSLFVELVVFILVFIGLGIVVGLVGVVILRRSVSLVRPGFVFLPIGVALAVAIVGIGVRAGVAVWQTTAMASGFISYALFVAGAGVAMATCIFLLAVVLKLIATIRYLPQGWAALVDNWRQLVWAQDLRRPPELLPGLDQRPNLAKKFSAAGLVEGIMDNNKYWGDRIIASIFAPFVFLPAWFYRLSIKSTCWFYWPLVFAHKRIAAVDLGDKALLETLCKTLFSKGLAALSIVLLVRVVDPFWFWLVDLIKLPRVDQIPPMLVKQFGDMGSLGLLVAGISLLVFLLANSWLPRAGDDKLKGWRRTLMIQLIGLRWFCVCCALVLGLILLWAGLTEDNTVIVAPQPIVVFSSLVHKYYLDIL